MNGERERSSRGVVSHSLVAQSTWNGRPLRGQSACRMQPRPLFGCAQARIARGEATARQHRHDAEQRASARIAGCAPFRIASGSFVFHISATSFASGSSGLGAESSAWIERSTVRI